VKVSKTTFDLQVILLPPALFIWYNKNIGSDIFRGLAAGVNVFFQLIQEKPE